MGACVGRGGVTRRTRRLAEAVVGRYSYRRSGADAGTNKAEEKMGRGWAAVLTSACRAGLRMLTARMCG